MSRIIKNVLPYWKSIVLVFALLIVQAVCDLSLPAYTSDIIDTLSTILEQYKLKNKPILDIKINRGTLEDHFIELSKEVRS